MILKRGHAGLVSLVAVVTFLGSTVNLKGQYTDVTIEQDIWHTYNEYDIMKVGGVGFFDWDRDGWDDLTLTTNDAGIIFYHNNQGTFELIDPLVDESGQIKQVLWVDYDNDYDSDLFVLKFEEPYVLYNNDGNGHYYNVTANSGFPVTYHENMSASWGDYNKDGYLDVYVCTYNNTGGITNYLFRNNTDGTFDDVTTETNSGTGVHYSMQALFIDADRDSWQDLFVANDRFTSPNFFLQNSSGSSFMDISETANVNDYILSMCAEPGDFDNDGDLDIYVTNTITGNYLYRYDSDITYTNAAGITGCALNQFTWGSSFFDWNNDGRLDLFVAASPFLVEPGHQYLLQNSENFTFTNASAAAGFGNYIGNAQSNAIGDFNNDGFVDLFNGHFNFESSHLWENNNTSGNFIKVTLQGTFSNADGIGSYIETYCGDEVFLRYTLCGQGYMNQNSQHIHIGIDDYDVVDSLIVTWPTGQTDKWYDVQVNQSLILIEGTSAQITITALGPTIFCEGGSVVLDAGDYNSFLWNNGYTGRYLTVTESGIYSVQVIDFLGYSHSSYPQEVIVNPLPIVMETTLDVTCNGSENGSAEVQFSTGGGYIMWDNEYIGSILEFLGPGIYYYTVHSINECSFEDSVIISQPALPELIAGILNISCNGVADGEAEIDIANFNIQDITWSNGWTEQHIYDLTPGTYTYDLHYHLDCELSGEVIILEPEPFIVNLNVANVSCFGMQDGSVTMEVSGNNGPPYIFDWGVVDTTACVAGTYSVIISDSQGCILEQAYEIVEPVELLATIETIDEFENGEQGSAEISIFGGTPPYEIDWSSGQADTTSVEGLSAGWYSISVEDANGCQWQAGFEIGLINGMAITVPGEMKVYPNPVQDELNIVPPDAGSYILKVQDSRGNLLYSSPKMISGSLELSLAGYAPGVYFVRIVSGYGSFVTRVIRN